MDSPIEILNISQLAAMLHKSPSTVATEASTRPDKLPPRLCLPGSRRVLWLRTDVEDWINKHRET